MRKTITAMAVLAIGFGSAACSAEEDPATSGAATAACPTDPGTPAQAGGTPLPSGSLPAGGPGPGQSAPADGAAGPGGAGGITAATSIAPSDTSTSVVLTADGPQITCGKVGVDQHADVTYASPTTAGAKIDLKMDVLVPATEGAKPVVVYLSGGGFTNASKEAAPDQRTYLAEAGFVVASIQYRTTSNGAIYSDAVKDVRSAVRYLRAHAAEYSIDAEHIAVYGESAGGYLAAMVGTTNGIEDLNAGDNLDQSGDVQAVVDKFGPSDLAKIGADFDPAAQEANVSPGNNAVKWVLGPTTTKSVTTEPAAVRAANPATYADSGDPAFLLLHGDDDRLVSPSQTLLVHEALRAKGVDSTRYVIPGAGHGDMAFFNGGQNSQLWTTQKVMDPIVEFLTSHLR